MWSVCHAFFDLEDGNYRYEVGDFFPRKGKGVSEARLAFLASDKNRLRTPVIQEVKKRKKKVEG